MDTYNKVLFRNVDKIDIDICFPYDIINDLRCSMWITSNGFHFDDCVWYLIVKKIDSGNSSRGPWISVNIESNTHSTKDFSFAIRDKNDRLYNRFLGKASFGPGQRYGSEEYIEDYILHTFKRIHDDKDTICFNCSLMDFPESEDILIENLYLLADDLENLFETGLFSDVIIRVGTSEFKAHRSILVSRSKVLQKMFENQMAEGITGEVVFTDFSPDIVRFFLHFLYTGSLDFPEVKSFLELYRMGHRYEVESLKIASAIKVAKTLRVETFCDEFPVVMLYDDSKLQTNVINFFVRNSEKIMKESNWKTFSEKHESIKDMLISKLIEAING